MGSLLSELLYDFGSCSSCGIDVWGKIGLNFCREIYGWFLFFFRIFLSVWPNRKETTVYYRLDSVRDLPAAYRFQSTIMMRSAFILSLLRASMKRICWMLCGTSRPLIHDADEEKLRHPLQPRMSREQISIFAIRLIDCEGCPMLLTFCSTIGK